MSSKHVHTWVMLIDLKNHSSFGDHFCYDIVMITTHPGFNVWWTRRILPWRILVGKYGFSLYAIWPRYPPTHAHGRRPGSISADKNGITLCVCVCVCVCVCKCNYSLSLTKNHKFAPPLPCIFGDLFLPFCLQKRTKQADPGIMAVYHLMASSNQLK
jgi:hypothetical protein